MSTTRFKKGDLAPVWLVNGRATFGADVVVEETEERFFIRPQNSLQDGEAMISFQGEPEFPPFKKLVTIWNEPKP